MMFWLKVNVKLGIDSKCWLGRRRTKPNIRKFHGRANLEEELPLLKTALTPCITFFTASSTRCVRNDTN